METPNIRTENPSCISGKKIVIAGAGMAGLSFALSLQRQFHSNAEDLLPRLQIYERDTEEAIDDREGYSLSIRSDSYSGGMQVLHKLGILDSVFRHSFSGTSLPGGFVIWDNTWKELLRIKEEPPDMELPASSMRVSRKLLRNALIRGLASKDNIIWGTKCVDAKTLDSGKILVELDNGKCDECDILIVADGSNSTLRKRLRPDDNLCFAGAVMICATARFPDTLPPPLNNDWGSLLSGTGTGLFASPIDSHSVVWSLSYLQTAPRRNGISPMSQEEAEILLKEVLERGKPFTEPFSSLIAATDISTLAIINAMDKQPFSHQFGFSRNDSRMIFIGDSNHAMSPFAGNGANMALMDGWELVQQLCKSKSLSTALAKYDSSSVPRSTRAIKISRWSIDLAHAQGWKLWLFKTLFQLMRLVM